MGNVKQPVLLQQGQSVFIECEIGTVITHDGQCIQPLQIAAQTILFAETFKVYLRQLVCCNVSRGAERNQTFRIPWNQSRIFSRMLISSGISSYGSACVCVCVCIAKEAVWLATDQLLLSSQRRLNREIFVAIRPGAACKRGSHLCRWYRGSCLYSLLDFHAVTWYWPSLPVVLYTLKLFFTAEMYYYCAPNEKCWKCSNRSKLDWCCFVECHHPHCIFRNLQKYIYI